MPKKSVLFVHANLRQRLRFLTGPQAIAGQHQDGKRLMVPVTCCFGFREPPVSTNARHMHGIAGVASAR